MEKKRGIIEWQEKKRGERLRICDYFLFPENQETKKIERVKLIGNCTPSQTARQVKHST